MDHDNANHRNHQNQQNGRPIFMRSFMPYSLRSMYLLNALMLMVVLAALAGCGVSKDQDQSKNKSDKRIPALQSGDHAAAVVQVPTAGTALPTATGIETAMATVSEGTETWVPDTLPTHIAHATVIAAFQEELRTSVTLTHEPTITPGLPPAFPSPTPILGMLTGCSNVNTYEPQALSCWRGVVNGELVDVGAGREGRGGDMQQGVIMVHVEGQEGQDLYQTLSRVGAVEITSVSGTSFTLSTVSQPTPQQFVFDIATRQWVP